VTDIFTHWILFFTTRPPPPSLVSRHIFPVITDYIRLRLASHCE